MENHNESTRKGIDMTDFIDLATIGVTVLGILAFTVSVITQVIKEVSSLADKPTEVVVVILSLLLTEASLVAYSQFRGFSITWYMLLGAFIGGFFVAFVAMFGWDKFTSMWQRFSKETKGE